MDKPGDSTLSQEAREAVEMIRELAEDVMLRHYESLTVGMKMRLTRVTKNVHHMLNGEEPG